MLAFQRAAGVEMTHVPFKGAADVRTTLVGGHIMVGAINIGEAMVAPGERRADPSARPDEPAAQRRGAGRADLQGAGLRHRAQLAPRHRSTQGAAGRLSASAW